MPGYLCSFRRGLQYSYKKYKGVPLTKSVMFGIFVTFKTFELHILACIYNCVKWILFLLIMDWGLGRVLLKSLISIFAKFCGNRYRQDYLNSREH